MLDSRHQHHLPLGELLRSHGLASSEEIEQSLRAQSVSGARIGEILSARGHVDAKAISRVAAMQKRLPFVDLAAVPMDPSLAQGDDLDSYLTHRIAPWRREGGRVVFAAEEPEGAQAALARLAARPAAAEIGVAEPREFRSALIRAFSPSLARRAADRREAGFSLRLGAAPWQRTLVWALAGVASLGVMASPMLATAAAIYLFAAVIAINALIWLTSTLTGRQAPRTPSPDLPPRPPRITILVPLYKEPESAPLLIQSLSRLDYPPELLDVKLILETGDEETAAALAALALPPFAEVLTAPDGWPRTKPRALNFALDFARGDLVGIYDAEDRPPPDQLRRIVAAFADAGPEVVCVQARLGYYNAGENLLTRCFEIEYAAWFDVMLPGLRALDLPIPLGGTSLFVRRAALEALGGWDSHNVTEDADLGMMIARSGWRTALCPSLTEEEANNRPLPWIRQRSRWLKGYLATWMTHMRRPAALWRDVGPVRFVAIQTILLGAVLGYLAMPLMWVAAAMDWVTDLEALFGPAPARAVTVLGAAAVAAAPVMVLASAIGLRRRGSRISPFWMLCLPVYWLLGAVAAYLAVFELIVAPTKWRKTRHGVSKVARRLNEEAAEALEKRPS